eukprot:5924496-Prymnesium_polylepis.1
MASEAAPAATPTVRRTASFSRKNLKMTASDAIKKLTENVPSFATCDLSSNAVLQMKGKELLPQLATALAGNTVCTELNLTDCGIDDAGCEHLGKALESNKTLTHLNLEKNKVHNDGAIALAKGLAVNTGMVQLNLMNQTGARYGVPRPPVARAVVGPPLRADRACPLWGPPRDRACFPVARALALWPRPQCSSHRTTGRWLRACAAGDSTLTAYLDMFNSNVTLLKIVWRLESRQSFRLTKMLTRNNDIDRRIKA